MTVNTDWFPFEDQRWRRSKVKLQHEFLFTTYTYRYGPVSLDLSVVVSQTTGPRDSPHRRGSVSGTGPLESVSRGPVPDP